MNSFLDDHGDSRGQRVQPKTLVLGLGKTGLSCARYLRSQGVPVAVTDTRSQPPCLEAARAEMPDLPLFLGGFDSSALEAAERLVISPGIALGEPRLAAALGRGLEVVGDIELFARAAQAPIVGITGSNGKSTVTTLVGEMAQASGLRTAVGGNLGEPALELLDPAVELYVLELSSFQLETTWSLRPRVATVLNISADHLDRYPSLEAYAATKASLLRGAEVALLNRDDPKVAAMAGLAGRDIWFGLGAPQTEADFGLLEGEGAIWLARGHQLLVRTDALPLAGRHNLANALAALALGEVCGLPLESRLAALRVFQGLAHRTVLVATRRGVRWFDDSKGTNPGATVAALLGLIDPAKEGRAVLIAGGDGKGADFGELAETVGQTARAVILMGRDGPRIEDALAGRVLTQRARDMEEAVRLAAEIALPGDSVLLSPACASFDMFDNYEHRGRVFVAAVKGLGV
ncbi:MAG: UDP-N-acetylmuramoyl-L-alanine--D-glutamate ligase [Chromatiaceae bacterium]